MKVETKNFKLTDVTDHCDGTFLGRDEDPVINGFFTDSREVIEGGIFIAIKGERVNGADYIAEVISKGASYVISSEIYEGYEDKTILASDPEKAIGMLAAWHRSRMKGLTVAAVTGSVGKTTTKEMIYSVLSEKYKTHKTTGNHNSTIGLPLSILTLDESYEAAVYELGMGSRGEIKYLSEIVRPSCAVITNIGSMHIEYLGSREAIRDAKLEITSGLDDGGELVLNGDEPLLEGRENAIYVSLDNQNSDIYAYNIFEGKNGTSFDMRYRGERIFSVVIPTLGRHNVLNAAMAYVIGKSFGMTEYEIRRGLMNYVGENLRQRIYSYKDITFIEDCYNAGPESMSAALEVLRDYSKRNGFRPVAVLGEMRELGMYSDSLHESVGEKAAKTCELLVAIGNPKIPDGAVKAGMRSGQIIRIPDRDDSDAAKIISSCLRPGDCILFKASRALHLETLIDDLKKVY